jgi:hypothetical protein
VPSGLHDAPLMVHGGHPKPGVYFVRIHTTEGTTGLRIAVLE